MEDLKDKIIYLQDDLITCLKTISKLEHEKRNIESLKKEIEKLKIEKMKSEYHKCEGKEYSCDDAATYSNKIPTIDFTSSIDNCCDKEYKEEAI